jgi:hypothetical protein
MARFQLSKLISSKSELLSGSDSSSMLPTSSVFEVDKCGSGGFDSRIRTAYLYIGHILLEYKEKSEDGWPLANQGIASYWLN